MINLYVEDYCQDCPYFDPKLMQSHPYSYLDNKPLHVEKYIVCENRIMCHRIMCQRVQKWYTKKENDHD